MSTDDDTQGNPGGVSRRDFLKVSGATLSVPLLASQTLAAQETKIYGPGKVPLTLQVNGKTYSARLEPRVTLLDALRDEFDLTGAKRVCDRGSCGACTVLLDGKTAYACSMLALEAQGRKITTVEGLAPDGRLHPLQQAIVDHDGQQCGFCTPGFVVACKALLDTTPQPTLEQIHRGFSGNLCRCGTYVGLKAAVLQIAAAQKGGRQNG
jgi:xanthine dehydrogenase YagT iron-sulfur-binding subunit